MDRWGSGDEPAAGGADRSQPPAITWRSLQPGLWIGFLAGWVFSGLAVATKLVGGVGATVVFFAFFIGVGAFVFDRRQRMLTSLGSAEVPGPWDGHAWEGWLTLAGRVVAALIVVRILSHIDWSRHWTDIFWRIH